VLHHVLEDSAPHGVRISDPSYAVNLEGTYCFIVSTVWDLSSELHKKDTTLSASGVAKAAVLCCAVQCDSSCPASALDEGSY
jgi:hypothetical protein